MGNHAGIYRLFSSNSMRIFYKWVHKYPLMEMMTQLTQILTVALVFDHGNLPSLDRCKTQESTRGKGEFNSVKIVSTTIARNEHKSVGWWIFQFRKFTITTTTAIGGCPIAYMYIYIHTL